MEAFQISVVVPAHLQVELAGKEEKLKSLCWSGSGDVGVAQTMKRRELFL